MELKQVTIKNFRSIRSETIIFDPTCKVLVGLNESGKSNILAALALLSPDVIPTPEDVREGSPDEDQIDSSQVQFVFTPSDDDRAELLAYLRARIALTSADQTLCSSKTGKSTLEAIVEGTEFIYIVNVRQKTRYWTTWTYTEKLLSVPFAVPRTKTASTTMVITVDGTSRNLSSVSLVQRELIEGVPEGLFRPATISDLGSLVIAGVGAVASPKLPKCLAWKFSNDLLLPGRVPLVDFRNDPSRCVPLQRMFLLAGVVDIPVALAEAEKKTNGVRNLLNRVADRCTKQFRQIWKEYKSVNFMLGQNGDAIECVIQDTNNVYDMSRRSDGFKRFVSFMIMVSSQVRSGKMVNTLLLLDEPDLGLHPSGIRYLRDELLHISKNNPVVIATHSIFMIDPERIDRHLLVVRKDEVASVSTAGASNIVDDEVIFNAVGYSIFQHLPQCNLLFEGWRDKKFFRTAMTKVPKEKSVVKEVLAKVGTCHAAGVKDLARVAAFIELAKRQAIILSDADKPAKEHQARFDGDATWLTYEDVDPLHAGKTTEDFLSPEYIEIKAQEFAGSRPQLTTTTKFKVHPGTPVIIQFNSWIRSSGVDQESLKQMCDEFKSMLSDHLQNKHIIPEYYSVLEIIAQKMSTVTETVSG